MTIRQRVQFLNLVLGMFFHALLSFCLLVLLCLFWFRSFGGHPASEQQARLNALELLRGLKMNLTQREGGERMQTLFPEGACFTWTLYGLAWANVVGNWPSTRIEREEALSQIQLALKNQDSAVSVEPFTDTQVRRGVFWMGQRNLLLGRMLELTPPADRNTSEAEEFHRNSRDLHGAFMKSVTHHLDSYEDMCWPADNVTALASLGIHDRLYGTDYRSAFAAWKDWTTSNSCELTGLPSGRIYSDSGQLIEPARGCANSWILPLIAELDAMWAGTLYKEYCEKMTVEHLGFRMFREYPEAAKGWKADIDSGPVIWSAGVTATGVGLATSRTFGDTTRECDIRDLSRMFGVPSHFQTDNGTALWHGMGFFPVGDAFLAWGWSHKRGSVPAGMIMKRSWRPSFHLVMFTVVVFVMGQYALLTRRSLRRLRRLREATVPAPFSPVP